MTSSGACSAVLSGELELFWTEPLSPERLISENMICLEEKVANGGPAQEVAEFAHRKEAARG